MHCRRQRREIRCRGSPRGRCPRCAEFRIGRRRFALSAPAHAQHHVGGVIAPSPAVRPPPRAAGILRGGSMRGSRTRSIIAAAIAAALLPSLAMAQETAAGGTTTSLDKVEVTGSRIKRTDVETVDPIQLFTAEDLSK